MKIFNSSIEVVVNHASKRPIDREQLRTMFHEIIPSIMRMIINKNDIMFITTLWNKRSWASNARINKIKRSSRMRITCKIRSICFLRWELLQWNLESDDVWPKQPNFIKVDRWEPHKWLRRWCHRAKETTWTKVVESTRVEDVVDGGMRNVSWM
jgi:hypothetical protein